MNPLYSYPQQTMLLEIPSLEIEDAAATDWLLLFHHP